MDKTRLLATVAAVTATAGLLAACAPGSGTSSETESTAVEPSDINTDLSGLGDITLTVWDQLVRGGQDEQIQRLNEAFMDKYPNITIERVSQSFDDLETTLRGALTGNDAPDVVQANNGREPWGPSSRPGCCATWTHTRRPMGGATGSARMCWRSPATPPTASPSVRATCTGCRRSGRSWGRTTPGRRWRRSPTRTNCSAATSPRSPTSSPARRRRG